MWEKYNLTESNPTITGLTNFETFYLNLTNVTTVKNISLDFRQQESYDDAVWPTYWRIYVPRGVAGSCSGNIVFGATSAVGS